MTVAGSVQEPSYKGTQVAGGWPQGMDAAPEQVPCLVGGMDPGVDLGKKNTVVQQEASQAVEEGEGLPELQIGRISMIRGSKDRTWMVMLQEPPGSESAGVGFGEVLLGLSLLRRVAQKSMQEGLEVLIQNCKELTAQEWAQGRAMLEAEQPWEGDELVDDYSDGDETEAEDEDALRAEYEQVFGKGSLGKAGPQADLSEAEKQILEELHGTPKSQANISDEQIWEQMKNARRAQQGQDSSHETGAKQSH